MANRIAVMGDGRIRQVARPAELYEFPNCRFVADVIGKMNLFEDRVTGRQGDEVTVEVAGLGRLLLRAAEVDGVAGSEASGAVGIAVRPEKVRIHRERAGEGRVNLRGRVSQIANYGDTGHVFVVLEGGQTISAHIQNEARSATPAIEVGQELWCSWESRDTLVLTS